jgi:hypothetical protein
MEETISTDVKLRDLKKGDEVTLSHTGVVSGINEYKGHVRLKDGARIRMEKGTGWDAPINPVLYTAVRKEVPVQFLAGEVWTDDSGETYYILNGYELKAYTKTDKLVLVAHLKNKPGIRRVFAGVGK